MIEDYFLRHNPFALGLRQAKCRTAALLSIRYITARTQLSSVLEKSGLTRQSELMLRVAALR